MTTPTMTERIPRRIRVVLLCAVAMLCASVASVAAAQNAAAETAVTSRDACGLTTGRIESFHQYDDEDGANFEALAALAWSPDSQYLAVWLNRLRKPGVPDPTPIGFIWVPDPLLSYLQIWHVPSKTLLHELKLNTDNIPDAGYPDSIFWREDSTALAVARYGRFHVWQGGDDWSFIRPTDGEQYNAAELFWIDDNQTFVSVRSTGTVPPDVTSGGGQALYYDAVTGELIESEPSYRQLHFIQDGNSLLQVTRDEITVTVTDLTRDKVLFVAPRDHYFTTIRVTDEMTVLVTKLSSRDNATADHAISTVWDVSTGQTLITFDTDFYDDSRFSFSPDGSVLAVDVFLKGADFWDVHTGQLLARPTFESSVSQLNSYYTFRPFWAPDGLWDVHTGQLMARPNFEAEAPELNTYYMFRPFWSPDGQCLLARGIEVPYEPTQRIFPLVMVDQTDYENVTVLNAEKVLELFEWSPDSRMLAYVERDSEDLRIWYRDDTEADDADTADD